MGRIRQRFDVPVISSGEDSAAHLLRGLDIASLEDRILFSAVPLPIDLVEVNEIDPYETLDANEIFEASDRRASDRDEFNFIHFDEDGNIEPDQSDDPLAARQARSIENLPADKGLDETVHVYRDADDEISDRLVAGEVAVIRRELVFVDISTENHQRLVNDLFSDRTDGREVEVLLISADENGLERVTQTVRGRREIDAIHFVTHGSDRGIKLGNTWLTQDSLAGSASDVSGWGDALAIDGDLLFYGCDLAGSESGESLLKELQSLTDADVAASTDKTGAARLNGDWELEYEHGVIETEIVFSDAVQLEWQGILGTDGIISTDIDPYDATYFNAITTDMTLQSDDKAIVVTSYGGIFRYNLDGSLDTSFGSDGHVAVDIDYAESVTVQNDGKILVAGRDGSNFAVFRLNTDGILDASFSGDGMATANFGRVDHAKDVTVQDDGKIVLVGSGSTASSNDKLQVARFNSDGTLDSTFSGDGREAFSFGIGDYHGNAVELQADGKIVIAGTFDGYYSDFLLLRLNSNGSLDTTFSGDGYIIDDLSGSQDYGYDLVIQSDGRIVVGGSAFFGDRHHTLVRYNSDGGRDNTFSDDGIASRKIGSSTNVIYGVDIQSDGKLVTTGQSSSNGYSSVTVLRFNTDGSYDSSFGTAGSYSTRINNGDSSGVGIEVQSDGKVVAAASITSGTDEVGLMRLTSSGSLDPSLVPGYNFAPEITSNGGGSTASVSVAENATTVVTVASTDANGDTLTYSIVDVADSTRFSIGGSTGVLSFVSGPNYESPSDSGGDNVYEVTVQVNDGNGGIDTQAISVAVTDSNEFNVATPIDNNVLTNLVAENASNGTTVGITASAMDADGTNNAVTYSLANDADGRFSIDRVTGVVTVANSSLLNRESAGAHTITVVATSSDGSTGSSTFSISVSDVDEFAVTNPTDSDAAANSVSENAANGTAVGITADAADADATDSVSYSLTDNAGGRFAIDSSTGVVTVANSSLLDRETTDSHVIAVRATSSDGSTSSSNFTINVRDVDEFDVTSPADVDGSANTVAEDAVNGAIVGISIFADDSDATDSITYSLTDDAGGRFAIDSTTGVVTVANTNLLDRETAASHSITVQATSSDSSYSLSTFAIDIDDANDTDVGAIINTAGGPVAADENAAMGTSVGLTVFASADATESISYSLDDDAGGRFVVDATTGEVTVRGAIDRENEPYHDIIVRATSSDGSSSMETFRVIVNDLDETDVGSITNSQSGPIQVSENVAFGTSVGLTASAADEDSTDTVTYSLDNDAAGLFVINGFTGEVTVNGPIDREAAADYSITVRATSSDGSASTGIFTIGINDVNETSVGSIANLEMGSIEVTENATVGASIGLTALAVDEDSTDSITYSLDNDAGGLFAIDNSTGRVAVAGSLDYESASRQLITVRATSTDMSFSIATYEVIVVDENDNTPVIAAGQSFSVSEMAAVGYRVGSVSGSDPDTVGGLQNWRIVAGNDDGFFAVDANTGEITIAADANLDYELHDSITLIVTVEDGTNISSLESVVIHVDDVNESPQNIVPRAVSVVEDIASSVSGISIFDPDGGGENLSTRLQVEHGVLHLDLVGATFISSGRNGEGDLTLTGNRADINASLASLRYTGAPNATGIGADTLTITTTDDGGDGVPLQDVDSVRIDIDAVNDVPVVNAPIESLQATEQTSLGIHGTGFSVSDVENTGSISTATITTGEGVVNVFVGDSGVLVSAGNGTSSVTLTGTIEQINNLLTGAGNGTIDYFNPSDAPSATTFILVTVNDHGNSTTDPGPIGDTTGQQGSNSVTVTLTATNDAPFNTGLAPERLVVVEDAASGIDLSPLDIQDADQSGGSFTLTLTTAGEGHLFSSSDGGVAVRGSGTASLTLNGSLVDLNAFLNDSANIQYSQTTEHLNGELADTIFIRIGEDQNLGPDENDQVSLGEIKVDITPINDLPVATSDQFSLLAGETLSEFSPGLLGNDADVEMASLTATLVGGPSVGDLSLNADGSFTYTAPVAFFGEVTFRYRVSDGEGFSEAATVTIDVYSMMGSPDDEPNHDFEDSHEDEEPNEEEDDENLDETKTTELTSDEPRNGETEAPKGREPTDHESTERPATGPYGDPMASFDQVDTTEPENLLSNLLVLPERHDPSDSNRVTLRAVRTRFGEGVELYEITLDDFATNNRVRTHNANIATGFLWSRLDAVSEDVQQEYATADFVAGSGMVVSSTMIAGYVVWSLRTGYAFAWISSATPVWTHFDPLPILNSLSESNAAEDESLVDILRLQRS